LQFRTPWIRTDARGASSSGCSGSSAAELRAISLDREATAILRRRDSEVLSEDAPHCADVAEPRSRADFLDGEIGLLEQSSRLIDSDAAHELRGRLVEVRTEPTAQCARAHSGAFREPLDRQRLVEVSTCRRAWKGLSLAGEVWS